VWIIKEPIDVSVATRNVNSSRETKYNGNIFRILFAINLIIGVSGFDFESLYADRNMNPPTAKCFIREVIPYLTSGPIKVSV
jgi:hypothetical protein